jgi:sporadic carbohydrate cluster protein (TIGR04323 family)|tara:strand:- start:131 stop:526 length:396 start_codon:yes stop_codon:yes gene_type:complete
MNNVLKGYIFSRTFMGERVPQSVQNLLLRDYCKRKKYNFHLSSVEYCIENSFMHLNNLVNNLEKYDGIIAYSLFQLPKDPNVRKKLLIKIVNNKKTFHCAIENIIIKDTSTIEKINDIWSIKQTILSEEEA